MSSREISAYLLALSLASSIAASPPASEAAAALFENRCLMCHSRDLVDQQRLTPAQWEKVLTKMHSWGVPLEPDEKALLSGELARRQPAVLTRSPPIFAPLSEAEASLRPEPGTATEGNADRGAPLFATSCASCHGSDARGKLAPGLAGRAILLRPADWSAIVAKGRRGMPAFAPLVTGQASLDLLAHVRRLSERP